MTVGNFKRIRPLEEKPPPIKIGKRIHPPLLNLFTPHDIKIPIVNNYQAEIKRAVTGGEKERETKREEKGKEFGPSLFLHLKCRISKRKSDGHQATVRSSSSRERYECPFYVIKIGS